MKFVSNENPKPSWWLLTLPKVLNPVMLVALFGPSFMVFGFKAIKGGVSTPDESHVGDLLGTASIPGLIDYTIQYYTLLMLASIWAAAWLSGLFLMVLHACGHRITNLAAMKSHKFHTFLYGALGLVIGGWLFYLFFLGGIANPKVLQMYVDRTTTLGNFVLPPLESPIFLARVLVGIHSILISFWRVSLVSASTP